MNLPKGRDVLLRSSLPGLYGVDGTASLTNVSLEFEGKLVESSNVKKIGSERVELYVGDQSDRYVQVLRATYTVIETSESTTLVGERSFDVFYKRVFYREEHLRQSTPETWNLDDVAWEQLTKVGFTKNEVKFNFESVSFRHNTKFDNKSVSRTCAFAVQYNGQVYWMKEDMSWISLWADDKQGNCVVKVHPILELVSVSVLSNLDRDNLQELKLQTEVTLSVEHNSVIESLRKEVKPLPQVTQLDQPIYVTNDMLVGVIDGWMLTLIIEDSSAIEGAIDLMINEKLLRIKKLVGINTDLIIAATPEDNIAKMFFDEAVMKIRRKGI